MTEPGRGRCRGSNRNSSAIARSYSPEVTCLPDCYHSEVESGSFMMTG